MQLAELRRRLDRIAWHEQVEHEIADRPTVAAPPDIAAIDGELQALAAAVDGTLLDALTGTDGTVRSVTRDATGGDAGWRPVGAGAGTDPASSLAANCRAEGQIEVFAEADHHHLTWTWWS